MKRKSAKKRNRPIYFCEITVYLKRDLQYNVSNQVRKKNRKENDDAGGTADQTMSVIRKNVCEKRVQRKAGA